MEIINLIGGLLYQWDTGRKVKIMSPSCISVDEVHFTNDMQDALVVEPKNADGMYYAEIPNILLQDKRDIKVYVVMRTETGEQTMFSRGLTVSPRQKPADYVYTETEVKSYEKLDQRIKALEGTAILTTPQELTAEERAQARANIGVAQPDLSVNDPTDPRHVLNRTHYESVEMVEILAECQPVYSEADGGFIIEQPLDLLIGETYVVNWNGIEYECVAIDSSALLEGAAALGNIGAITDGEDTGEPFVIIVVSNVGALVGPLDGSTELAISIYYDGTTIHKLDNKYLDLDWLPTSTKGNELLNVSVSATTSGTANGKTYYIGNVRLDNKPELVDGQSVILTLNGVDYDALVVVDQTDDGIALIVPPTYNSSDENSKFFDNGLFSFYGVTKQSFILVHCFSGDYTVAITEKVVDKLPEEYLPESVGKVKTVNGIAPDEDGNVEIEAGSGDGGITISNTASVGQVISVKAVDENGKPTEWECVEAEKGWTKLTITLDEAVSGIEIDLPSAKRVYIRCFFRLNDTDNSLSGGTGNVNFGVNGAAETQFACRIDPAIRYYTVLEVEKIGGETRVLKTNYFSNGIYFNSSMNLGLSGWSHPIEDTAETIDRINIWQNESTYVFPAECTVEVWYK